LADLVRLEPRAASRWFRWNVASSLVTIAGLALIVALVIWAATGSHPGAGLP
jgi:hypothetical protein